MNDTMASGPTSEHRGERRDLLHLGLCYAVVVLLYHVRGNTADVATYSASLFKWMTMRWSDATVHVNDYSHGWAIPVVALAMLWVRRHDLRRTPKAPWPPGLLPVGLALFMHWAGLHAQFPRISAFSLILILWSLPLYLLGPATARLLAYPCAYLVFCVPLNFLGAIALPLRLLAARLATFVLNGLGIATRRVGTAIYSAAGQGFGLDVADACSGIKYLLAITALTAGFAFFAHRSAWRRVVLVVSAIPLAVIANAARITAIALAARFFGQDFALAFYHTYSGLFVFVLAILLMLGVSALLTVRGSAQTEANS